MATEITDGGQATMDAAQRFGDPDMSVDDQFTNDFVDHDPAPGQPEGGGGLAWYWEQFGRSFSDLDLEVIETIATPEHMITVMNQSGTHTGEFRGHAPTGKRFTVRNVQVTKIVDGRLSERWGATDELGILEQLGLI